MNTRHHHIAIVLLLLALPTALRAQGESSQQNLMLQVTQLNKIDLTNPSIYIIIDKAPSEGDVIITSNSDGSILWTTNGENRKISVASNRTSSRFILKVFAENISKFSGTAGPEVTLDDERDHNLILGVSRTAGRCVLRLTAIASLTEGIGSETRILTYTIMND
jgi:hypothetical protein